MKKLLFLGKCLLGGAAVIAIMLGCCRYAGEKEKVVLSAVSGSVERGEGLAQISERLCLQQISIKLT